MKALSLQEAKEDERRKKGLIRCLDCKHRNEMVPNQGFSQTDKYCLVPVNGQRILNGMRNDQALTAWRRCASFEPDGEKKEDAGE